jgi:hypothetical protein
MVRPDACPAGATAVRTYAESTPREIDMNRNETLAAIRDYSPHALSGRDLADCGSPDTHESAGALLLTQTRDAFLRFIDSNPEATGEDIRDDVSAITGDMVSVYTHERWQEFVDLAAYQEECEFGEWPADLSDAAGLALYQILDRMVSALARMIDDAEEDGDNA